MVALHPEGVDRNFFLEGGVRDAQVALHPEGVDRNDYPVYIDLEEDESPSTRRAWIEITPCITF